MSGEVAADGTGVAVVVGATGAVGRAVVERLARRGLTVLAVARDAGRLGALVAEVHGVEPVVADIGTDDAIATVTDAVADRGVALALFAAGLPVRGSVATIEPGLLAVGTDVKVGGAVRLLRGVQDRFGRGSRFVVVAGTLGIEPGPSEAGPGVVNAALLNLTKQVSLTSRERGFTVHTLVPGPMDTPRLRTIAATVAEERGVPFDEVWAEYEQRTSLGRLPRVDEVAWAVELLLAPEADVLHGSVLHLDAGGLRGVH